MGVFKRMLTERDDYEGFLYENSCLQNRINELKERLHALSNVPFDEQMMNSWKFATDIQGMEADAVLPEHFMTEQDVLRAIESVQHKLLSLWNDYYGPVDNVQGDGKNNGQISIFNLYPDMDYGYVA